MLELSINKWNVISTENYLYEGINTRDGFRYISCWLTHHQWSTKQWKNYYKFYYLNKTTYTMTITTATEMQKSTKREMVKRWNYNHYNLIVSSLLFHSSLVLNAGLRSRWWSASRVRRKLSPLLVCWRTSMFSSGIDVLHCARWIFMGPGFWWCSFTRVCRWRFVEPT